MASAVAGDRPIQPPDLQTTPYAVTVELGKPVVGPEGELTVELLAVKDHRCAVDVLCVWAGYAEVTLRVSKRGSDAKTLVLGTLAPKTPTDRHLETTYGTYRFALVNLAPGNSMSRPVAQSLYRAKVQVSQL
jgi:hypothetical protein